MFEPVVRPGTAATGAVEQVVSLRRHLSDTLAQSDATFTDLNQSVAATRDTHLYSHLLADYLTELDALRREAAASGAAARKTLLYCTEDIELYKARPRG